MARFEFKIRAYHWEKKDGTKMRSWEVHGTPPGRKPIRKRFKLRKDADQFRREMTAQLRAGTLPLTTAKKVNEPQPTLLDWFDRFIENRSLNHKPLTVMNHRTRRGEVQHWLETAGGLDRPIGEFRVEHFEEMIAFFRTHPLPRSGKPASDNTIRGIHQSLKAIYRFVLKRQEEENEVRTQRGELPVHWASRNPLKDVKAPRPGKSDRFTAWKPPEVNQIDQQIEPFYRKHFRILVNTGMRIQELRHLRWDEVDLDLREITITPTEDYRPKHDMTRTIPFGDVVHQILLQQKGLNPKWVFPGKRPRYQVSKDTLLEKLKQAIHETGLQIKGEVIHCTRATFITNLFRKAIHPDTIMELAGHKDLKITMGYVRVDKEGMRTAVEMLDEIFTP